MSVQGGSGAQCRRVVDFRKCCHRISNRLGLGSQKRDETFYLDLLFYHIRLHRYFVIELKTGKFKPEWAGKLNFYLAALNGTMRTPVEGPSIGILLCESKSGPIVEFALENINQPIGVSTYRVTRELPAPIREELPTVEDLQEVVNKLRSEMESLRKELPNEE